MTGTSMLYDFGLDAEQEERARRLHTDSIVIDLVSRNAGSEIFDHYPPELRADLTARTARSTTSAEALATALYWPFELALGGESDLIHDWIAGSGLTCGAYEPILEFPAGITDALTWDWDARIHRYAELPWLRYVTTAQDIHDAKRDGAYALFGYCQPIAPAPHRLDAFDEAYVKGLRAFMLTYNRADHVGTGCGAAVDSGLTSFGREVVRRCDDLGIIVDTSHCGPQTTIDACRTSRNPVAATHTSAAAVYGHRRAKHDDVLRAVADTGGIVGILAVPAFLSDAAVPTIEVMLDHIDHVAALVGPSHVAIGTDWPWPLPDDLAAKALGRHENKHLDFQPQDPASRARRLRGYRDCRDLINITRGLVKRGYRDDEITGILGNNALRVFEEVCG